MLNRLSWLMLFVVLVLGTGEVVDAQVRDDGPEECFDEEVSARITAQVPSVPPEFDDGSIVMRWAWFIDFDVRGASKSGLNGPTTVLALQHTYWRSNLGYKRWLLRRNDQGTFNLLGLAKDAGLKRCAPDVPPARAYVSPGHGGTLELLREEGEKRYGRRGA